MIKRSKPVISYAIMILMIMALVLTRLNVKSLVSFALPETQDFVVGDQVIATWCEGTLTLHGKGVTYDYSEGNFSPIYELRNQTTQIIIENGVTGIGAYLFYDFGYLTGTLTIPGSVLSIGDCAFSGNSKETAPYFKLIDNQFVTHEILMDVLGTKQVSAIILKAQMDEFRVENKITQEESPLIQPDHDTRSEVGGSNDHETTDDLKKDVVIKSDMDKENGEDEKENSEIIEDEIEKSGIRENGTAESGIKEDEITESGIRENGTAESGIKEDEITESGIRENGTAESGVKEDEATERVLEENEAKENEIADNETIEDVEDKNLNGTISGNNISQEYRTIYAQNIGREIFFAGQIGGYMIADESNTTFVEAVEASGYGRYLGSRMITIWDVNENPYDVSVMNTAKGVLMPTLFESGLSLPANTAYIRYYFSCWESASGVYYLPGSYSNEAEFKMYLIKEYGDPEKMELSIALDERTTLSVCGEFPQGTRLCLKDFTVTYEEEDLYEFMPYYMIEDWVYEPSTETDYMFTIKSERFDTAHEVSLRQVIEGTKKEIPWQIAQIDEKYQICYEVNRLEKMELRIWEKEVAPETVECDLTLSGVDFLIENMDECVIKEWDDEHIELDVAYHEECRIPLSFSENYSWPINVHAFKDSNLLYTQSFEKEDYAQFMEKEQKGETGLFIEEDKLFYILSKDLLQDDIELHILATLKMQEVSRLKVGISDKPVYDWLSVSENSFASLTGVNEIEGFTISYEATNGFLDTRMNLCLLQGYFPDNTELFMQYETEEGIKLSHMTLNSSMRKIELTPLFEKDSLQEIRRFQLVFDYMCADLYGKNEKLYLSIEDGEHQLIADNGVLVEIDPVTLQAMDLYVETGNGVAKKEALIYEGTQLNVRGLKQANTADWYPYGVVCFYTDPECMIPAILPKEVIVSEEAKIVNNCVYFENRVEKSLYVSIWGLAGENGFTPGEIYYVKAYVTKECPEPFLIMKKHMITSNVVSIAIQNKPEYEMIVTGLDEGCVLNRGDSINTCQILYEARNLSEGQKIQVKAELSGVDSVGNDISFPVLKENIISKEYQFSSSLGMSAGSFDRVKLILPADLTSGMYRIRFVLVNAENSAELTDYMYYFVVNE